MVKRRGTSTLGCLVLLLGISVAVYVALQVGNAYVGRYRLEERFRQEIRFAARRSDDDIKARLRAWSDSAGYPAEAGKVGMLRSEKHMRIWSDYGHELRFLFFRKTLAFHPAAEGDF